MRTKRCSKCKKRKPINQFYKNDGKKDGYMYCCKSCDSNKSKIYYKENKFKADRKTRK